MLAGALTPSEIVYRMEGGLDLVKVFSLWPGRRREIHQGLEGTAAANTASAHRRCKSTPLRNSSTGAAALGIGGELVQAEALNPTSPN